MCSAAERGDTAGGIRESGDMLTLKLFDEMKGSPSLRSVRIKYRSAMSRVKGPKVNKSQPRTRGIYAKNDISYQIISSRCDRHWEASPGGWDGVCHND
jgi:hypothetical protein